MWTHMCLYHFLFQLSAVSLFSGTSVFTGCTTFFATKNDAAVPLFAQASGLSTSMWHATLSPPVITMVMALQHWVKYHLTLSDPQLSQSKHWNVTGPQKDTWCTLGTESVLGSGAASDSYWRENAKWSFTLRIKTHHSGQFCTTEAN